MIDRLSNRHTLSGLSVGSVASCWLLLELMGLNSFSLRLGFLIGLGSYPLLLWIYDYGFSHQHANAYKAMGLSFAFKGLLFFGSYLVLNQNLGLSFREYMFPLFFTVFFLGFVAIYLARQNSDFSFTSNRGIRNHD